MASNTHNAHVGDIGTSIRMTIKDQDENIINLNGNTSLQLVIKRPNGTILTKTATLFTDGTDGIMEYQTISGDFNESGSYLFQGYVVFPNGQWYTSSTKSIIDPNLA